MVYIYTLSHPITNEVRYVGKTINIKRRYKQHLYDKRTTHKANWIQSLRKKGLKPVLTIVEICEENWQEREVFWISQFDNLTNFLPGGGVDYKKVTTKETRKKISSKLIGRNLSEEHKKSIGSSLSKKVSIDGVSYDSISDACRKLNLTPGFIHYRLNTDKYNSFFYV